MTRFSTALREDVRKEIEQIGRADVVVGVPSYHSDPSISHVIHTIAKGLEQYYGDSKAVIFISDGGSTDDTRETARSIEIGSYNIKKLVTIYRGVPGKGSGLRALFEAAEFLKPKAVASFDSDLLSITPEWVGNVLKPVMDGFDYVAPDYRRYKYDATITNTVAYHLTRALYGRRIRQPIGGDFGMSLPLIRSFLNREVWETDVAKFGIDVWMTTTAIVEGCKICQARLGSKIHGEKDPAQDLGPMFRQVVGTTFQLMEQYENFWKKVKESKEVPTFGEYVGEPPGAFEVDLENLIEYFKVGFNNFSGVWKDIIENRDFLAVKRLFRSQDVETFAFPVERWVRIVYRYAAAFHETPRQRFKVLDTMIPLYYARVASLVNELKDKDPDEAEKYFEEHARLFETMKRYLLKIWK